MISKFIWTYIDNYMGCKSEHGYMWKDGNGKAHRICNEPVRTVHYNSDENVKWDWWLELASMFWTDAHKEWHKYNRLDRNFHYPAVITSDGGKLWYKHGKRYII
jgi:hypothetical protein